SICHTNIGYKIRNCLGPYPILAKNLWSGCTQDSATHHSIDVTLPDRRRRGTEQGGTIMRGIRRTAGNPVRGAFRAGLLGFTSLAAVGAAILPGSAAAQEQPAAAATVEFDIPEQSMADALNAFAQQAGKQIVVYSNDADNLRAGPVRGAMTERQALARILGDSGLEYVYINDRTIGVGRRDAEGRFIGADSGGAEDSENGNVILVTGRLLDAELSIEAKRDADQIVDVLSADQASQLPDQNVAESLSR